MFQTLIATTTVTAAGGAASIEFTGIPGTFTDLTLVISGRTATGIVQDAMRMQFNSDTGSNYSSRTLYADTISSSASTSYSSIGYFLNVGWFPGANNTASVFGNFCVLIPNYSASVVKTVGFDAVSTTNTGAMIGGLAVASGRWNSTAAITSIKLYSDFGQNLVQHSSASLYGTLKGSGGASVA
jgi:hypothetical protein